MKNSIDEEVLSDIKIIDQKKLNSLKHKVSNLNESVGHLREYDCPICKNKGVIYRLSKDYRIVCSPCSCQKIRRSIEDAKNNGFSLYIGKTFSDYKTNNEYQRLVLNQAMNFVDDILANKKYWWFIGGHTGSGKTLISSIICNELAKNNFNVKRINVRSFLDHYKRLIMKQENDSINTADKEMEEIKNYQVLLLDELFLYSATATDLKYLYQIIDHRYQSDLITLFTSEKDLLDLLKIDETLVGRIIEKTDPYNYNLSFGDLIENYRLNSVRKEI